MSLFDIAQLRHAYAQLKAGVVKDQARFADGLLSPVIKSLERREENMPSYLVFAGGQYYPHGGWSDYIGKVVSIAAAKDLLLGSGPYEWWQIVDINTLTVVESGGLKL